MISPEKLLCELIALPSVNPAFVSAGDTRSGELRVAEFLAASAAHAGLAVELQTVLPNRPNFVARLLPSRKISRRILLAPHLDTVPVANKKQFSPTKKNGRIYGRGACDTKGSVAAMFSALLQLAQSSQRPKETEIVFAGLMDEEDGQRGSRAIAASGLKADLAIVGEPTETKIVTAHKGSLWLRLETHGKSAHGAQPHLGKNAVHEMACVVEVLETEYRKKLKNHRHALLGHPTVCVGTIRGGTQTNIVPDQCEISVDLRTLPDQTRSGIEREMKKILCRKKLSATITDFKMAPCPSMETNFRLPMVQEFFHALNQKNPTGVDYFCDAAILSEAGIPSVVFGPGNIAQAHTADEWISVESLEQATDKLLKFFRTLP